MRYAIWNNKGGVGKTFLSFMLCSEYARTNPDKIVIAVDMCPQANLSEILLGGNGNGARYLKDLIKDDQTIGFYTDSRIQSPHQKTGRETEFFVHVKQYNDKIPPNVYLLVGDPRLEIQAQVINQISSQSLPENSWKNVHSWLLDLLISGEKKYGDCVTFIDCNPSFSAYTEISLFAATHIIIPCSSDGSSARAIDNLSALIYGHNLPAAMKSASFSEKFRRFRKDWPLVHSVLLNRSTQYDKKASQAFKAMFEEIKKRTKVFQQQQPQYFYSRFSYHDIPDAHSPAIVCSHQGLPISQLKPGRYHVHNVQPQVNQEPLQRYKESIEKFIAELD